MPTQTASRLWSDYIDVNQRIHKWQNLSPGNISVPLTVIKITNYFLRLISYTVSDSSNHMTRSMKIKRPIKRPDSAILGGTSITMESVLRNV